VDGKNLLELVATVEMRCLMLQTVSHVVTALENESMAFDPQFLKDVSACSERVSYSVAFFIFFKA
jgi:hypothetical protein